MYESELGHGLYDADNARAHASYMLCFYHKERHLTFHAHSRPQRPRSFWSAPRIAASGFTAVKRLGIRVNTRVI